MVEQAGLYSCTQLYAAPLGHSPSSPRRLDTCTCVWCGVFKRRLGRGSDQTTSNTAVVDLSLMLLSSVDSRAHMEGTWQLR